MQKLEATRLKIIFLKKKIVQKHKELIKDIINVIR